MARGDGLIDWVSPLVPGAEPYYLQIVQFIEEAVEVGRLHPGDRLPPQRRLADVLGVDFTTVTRAYGEARRRGLLEAVTGRGSFVSPRRETAGPPIDLGMNIPPPPTGMRLGDAIRDAIGEILTRTDANLLMAYHAGAGSRAERAAAAIWLRPLWPEVDADRIVVCAGAQTALVALLCRLVPDGGSVLCEALTYPGLIAASVETKRKTIPVAVDGEGMVPEALAEEAQRTRAKVVVITPTIHNPTTATMSEVRREAIVAVARRLDLTIVEDDPYALLALKSAPAPLAARAPERTWYVASLSKTLSPGLRTAYLVAPVTADLDPLLSLLSTLARMPAPLMTALATHWITIGLARDILERVRAEAEQRQALARRVLPQALGHPTGLHVWLALPADWDRHRLIQTVRREGLGIVASDAFAVARPATDAVRLALGGVGDRARLAEALTLIARTISRPPEEDRAIV